MGKTWEKLGETYGEWKRMNENNGKHRSFQQVEPYNHAIYGETIL